MIEYDGWILLVVCLKIFGIVREVEVLNLWTFTHNRLSVRFHVFWCVKIVAPKTQKKTSLLLSALIHSVNHRRIYLGCLIWAGIILLAIS